MNKLTTDATVKTADPDNPIRGGRNTLPAKSLGCWHRKLHINGRQDRETASVAFVNKYETL